MAKHRKKPKYKTTGKACKPRKSVSIAPMPFGGDHGTGTAAAMAGTVLEPVTDENGRNPNNMGRRRRRDVLVDMKLTMRQEQAAKAIRDAFCRVEMLSSGQALKETVDASPKPDAAVAAQVDANSRWVHVMRPVKAVDRRIVEGVCCYGQTIAVIQAMGYNFAGQRFRNALDAVADHMRY